MSDMQRFLSISFITLALVMSAAGAAPAAHAQFEQAAVLPDANTNTDIAAQANTDVTAARIAADKAANLTAVEAGQTPKLDGAMAQIMSFIMSLFAWLLGVAMIALNYAVYYTVVTMGNYVHNLAAVGVAWSILRDIGNIMLIFGFLAVGVTTIMNVDWYGGGKKMLPMMLVAAVFLNFSLFISEAVIDTGNLFATQFYTQINGGKLPTPDDMSKMTIASEGVSNKIMSQLGLAVIYGQATSNSNVFKEGSSTLIGFMSILVFIIAAFVMFSLAFILIFRFIALLFLIILSPVGFAGLAVPQLARRAKQWWDKLFEQTITAPILLLMLYIALAIITDVHFLAFGPKGDWSGFIPKSDGSANLAGFASIILSFLVAMGLLLAVVIQSKNLAAAGAGLASKAAGKLTFGLTAAGMRTTAGWGLNYAARRFRSARVGGVRLATIPIVGRSVAGALDRGAKASFDMRGVKIAGYGLAGGKVEAGEAQKGGYTQQLKEAVEGREKYAATLEMTKGEKEASKAATKLANDLEELGKTIQARNDIEMETLRAQQAAVLKPLNAEVDQKRKALQAAEAAGDKGGIDRAQLALNNALLAGQQKRDEQNKEREALKKEQDKKVNANNAEIANAKKRAADLAKAPQLEYAQNIQWGPGRFFYRNTKAADNIIKSAGKSKEQKDVEKIMELAKKYAAAEPGSTPAPAPAPAPAATS